MNRTFEPKELFEIPDGTMISPFLNSKDSMSDLPFDLVDGFSIAYGEIKKKSSSKIHVHPYVDQVIFVLSGKITLKMKGTENSLPYIVDLQKSQAGISKGGEFFQLVNPHDEDCQVLYIVSPAYLSLKEGGELIFDDSIILPQNWEELEKMNWKPKELMDKNHSKKARGDAYKGIKEKQIKILKP